MTLFQTSPNATISKNTESAQNRCKTAIINGMVADSHAMPVHWYYQRSDIMRAFPDGLDRLCAAPEKHPGAIMSLHSKHQGGRAYRKQQAQPVVGHVILKDKAQYWDHSHYHYHHGMQAGENTLNAHTVLWLLEAFEQAGNAYQNQAFLSAYIAYMTADVPKHPDTYAESYHRGFFANWVKGMPADQCAAVTHDTPSVGGLVRIGPLALLLLQQGHAVSTVKSTVGQDLDLTHPDAHLKRISFQYTELIAELLAEDDKTTRLDVLHRHLLHTAGKHFKRKPVETWQDHQVLGGLYSTACYITDSWPGVLYMANKYAHDTQLALIKNAELGGDNVHRGSVLALILSLVNGQRLSSWYDQLTMKSVIE